MALPSVFTERAAPPCFFADLHFPLSGAAMVAVQKANQFLSLHMRNEIDLLTQDTPHVTLYLTQWQPSSNTTLDHTLSSALHGLSKRICDVSLSNAFAVGQYAMVNVTVSPCLRQYSDTVVNATHKYSRPNQTVPAWVYNLPDGRERREKIAYVRRYGSPNVFDQFQPHVTTGWANSTEAVARAVAALSFEPIAFRANVAALGTTGPHGTVLSGKDMARFNLTVHTGVATRSRGVSLNRPPSVRPTPRRDR